MTPSLHGQLTWREFLLAAARGVWNCVQVRRHGVTGTAQFGQVCAVELRAPEQARVEDGSKTQARDRGQTAKIESVDPAAFFRAGGLSPGRAMGFGCIDLVTVSSRRLIRACTHGWNCTLPFLSGDQLRVQE